MPGEEETLAASALENMPEAAEAEPEKTYTLGSLEMIGRLGRGSFGVVKMVQTKDGEVLALKILSKTDIVNMRQEKNVLREKETLSIVNHPFAIRLKVTPTPTNTQPLKSFSSAEDPQWPLLL